ncbi:MAG: hypothetical protein ACSLFP_18415 [Acidimicrobiales bacterium]
MTSTPALSAPLHRFSAPTVLLGGAAVAIAIALVLPDSAAARAAVAGVLTASLAITVLIDRAAGILATTAYLATLGLLRRLVSMVQADPGNDPLLLVAPVVATLLALLALRDGAHRHRTPLTIAVAVFFALSVLAVLNPASSLSANLKGSLFWSVPLLWFAVGRASVDDGLLDRVLRLVTLLGLGACATGLVQAIIGFPPWDQRWIDERGYVALAVDGPRTLRPFGWSASAGEFALTAALITVLCALRWADAISQRAKRAMIGYGVGLGVAAAALVLSAVRTAVLLGLVALVVVVAARRGANLPRLVLGLALAVVVLVSGVRLLDVESWNTHGIPGLLRRSLVGITAPFDPQESTLGAHIDLTEGALRNLDDDPLGIGPNAGTTAPDRATPSAENDLGNAALAFGAPGFVLVLVTTALGLAAAWRAVQRSRAFLPLAVLGILVASLRFWWTGGHYATAALVWLVLGWLDRPAPADETDAGDPTAAAAVG